MINAAFKQSASKPPAPKASSRGNRTTKDIVNMTDRKCVLYQAAMIVKADINETSGIAIQPLLITITLIKKHCTVSRQLMRPFTTKKQIRDFCCMPKHTASNFTRIVVQLSDTDVLVLCCSQFSSLGCDELWFHTGTRDKT